MVTPSTSTGKLKPAGQSRRRKTQTTSRASGKSTQDYQEQADRMEEARDLADPDYREPRTTPRKRRGSNDISPRSAKKKSPARATFDSIEDDDSTNDRAEHVPPIRKGPGLSETAHSASPAPLAEDDVVSEEGDIGGPYDELAHGWPDLRSPTYAPDDRSVRIAPPSMARRPATERLGGGAWSEYDDAMEKLEEARLEAEEKEALAAARRAQREQIVQQRRIRELRRAREDVVSREP